MDRTESTRHDGAPVTTETGDDGYTSLLGPGRVAKYSSRPNAFGTLDEATSALGLAKALSADESLRVLITEFQETLYKAMAELATPAESYDKVSFTIGSADVTRLDDVSTELKSRVEIGRKFIIPGATADGAAIDVARTIVRRGERLVAQMLHQGEISNPHLLRWLNRLSDTLFILARSTEQ